jgi:release factor glutamine methyltransferase
MNIATALPQAVQQLEKAKISGAPLDTELLLGYVLGRDRAWLKAHDDTELTEDQQKRFNELIKRRSKHEPVVHLTGSREFYGLKFKITPDVLTPRVETEQMVDWAIRYAPANATLIDVGTGSGAIAIAIAKKRPDLTVTATDLSAKELEVAKSNAKFHGTPITFIESNLWGSVEGTFDIIVTNLPYLKNDADLMAEVKKEPKVALFGGPDGLDIYRRFLKDIEPHLITGGYLFTECDPWQQDTLIAEAAKHGLNPIEHGYFILGFLKG